MNAIAVVEPLVRRWLAERGEAFTVIGVAGSQGSGKSTLVRELAKRLAAEGLKIATLSLDDLYRTKAERQSLAREVHSLLVTRGVPGTHDVPLGLAAIDALMCGEAARLPRFDKGSDDRLPQSEWPLAEAGTQVLLLEGWCLGAAAQPEGALAEPVNQLEQMEDAAGIWRDYANSALARDYQALWARIDRLIFLAAPDWAVVGEWRDQQEADLRQQSPSAMTPVEVARFIQHYERLTRWMLAEMPKRADLTLRLDRQRQVI